MFLDLDPSTDADITGRTPAVGSGDWAAIAGNVPLKAATGQFRSGLAPSVYGSEAPVFGGAPGASWWLRFKVEFEVFGAQGSIVAATIGDQGGSDAVGVVIDASNLNAGGLATAVGSFSGPELSVDVPFVAGADRDLVMQVDGDAGTVSLHVDGVSAGSAPFVMPGGNSGSLQLVMVPDAVAGDSAGVRLVEAGAGFYR